MRTWFITGVSTGFGRAIANAALAAGNQAVGTLREEKQRGTSRPWSLFGRGSHRRADTNPPRLSRSWASRAKLGNIARR
jgi:NAD(P)-dependent dehydrogenase (short-subunit alcohol dehydrogenase family)